MHIPSLRGQRGFSIVEILIVIVVIGILAAIVVNYYSGAREKAYETRGRSDLESIANAAKLYANKNSTYPADATRTIPNDLKEFLASNTQTADWPAAAWPGSIFDYDAWDLDSDGTNETFQISIRFCPAGGPLAACKFPKQSWATNFNINSAYYYCIKGYCRSYNTEAYTYPGYCVNCPGNTAVKKPSE